MSDPIIQVENLSKCYRIGSREQGYKTFREAVLDILKSPVTNLRHLRSLSHFNHSDLTQSNGQASLDVIWALKNVSFEVQQGEILGVIGKNGAGKSTLLKVLSRITEPTMGEVKLYGRVSSLLEVGTGFHPELTGRENIYLNGSILGMRKKEIDDKFDEVVDFAEIEKFLNTPVKRYSSGMYVRLAFAVAAHLEPEILLVDEVLAVGDAAFQKKCLGKMENVSRGGRTVLFVSHNLAAVRTLCRRSLLLDNGEVVAEGNTNDVLSTYLSSLVSKRGPNGEIQWYDEQEAPGCSAIKLRSIRLLDPAGNVADMFEADKPIYVEITYRVYSSLRGIRFVLIVTTQDGVIAFASTDQTKHWSKLEPGEYQSSVVISSGLLNNNKYFIKIHAGIPGVRVLIPGEDFLSLTCIGTSPNGSYFPENWPGIVAPKLKWCHEKIDSAKSSSNI